MEFRTFSRIPAGDEGTAADSLTAEDEKNF
jgi:hypothetical protein